MTPHPSWLRRVAHLLGIASTHLSMTPPLSKRYRSRLRLEELERWRAPDSLHPGTALGVGLAPPLADLAAAPLAPEPAETLAPAAQSFADAGLGYAPIDLAAETAPRPENDAAWASTEADRTTVEGMRPARDTLGLDFDLLAGPALHAATAVGTPSAPASQPPASGPAGAAPAAAGPRESAPPPAVPTAANRPASSPTLALPPSSARTAPKVPSASPRQVLPARTVMPARPAAVSATATAGGGPHRVVTPYNSGEQPGVIRYVWMGNGMSPSGDFTEAVYNDYTANSLLGQIMATPDVMGPGAGTHVYTYGPMIGSAYPGYTWEDLVARPVSITYTVTGAEFAVVNPGPDDWTVSYQSTFTASGMEPDIYDQLQWVYLVPETGVTSITVSAQTENDKVTAPDGVITALTPVETTLTIPVPTPDYPDPEFLPTETNLLAVDTSEEGQPGQPNGQTWPYGIDWSTLSGKAGEATSDYPIDNGTITLKMDVYTVKTVTDATIHIQEMKPIGLQPQATQDYMSKHSGNITYNCHGLSFGTVNVAGGRNFWISQAADVKTLHDSLYKDITDPKDVTAGDVIVLLKGGEQRHSMVVKTPAVTNNKQGKIVLDFSKMTVSSKDGIQPQVNNQIAGDIVDFYIRKDRINDIQVWRLK